MPKIKSIDLIMDGEPVTCSVEVDQNDEYVCRAEDGRFFKFPKGDLKKMAKVHNKANEINE